MNKFPNKWWTKSGINRLQKRPTGDGRPQSACTKENVDLVNDLVLCQEDTLQTHTMVCEISRETDIHQLSVFRTQFNMQKCNKFEHLSFLR